MEYGYNILLFILVLQTCLFRFINDGVASILIGLHISFEKEYKTVNESANETGLVECT